MFNRKYLVYWFLLLLVCAGIFYRFFSGGNASPLYEPVFVQKGTVMHFVSVSGHVEPVERVVLSFPMGGKVEKIFFKEDTEVIKGNTIASLASGVFRATVDEAEVRVLRERAVLRNLLAPLRKEEKALKDTAVINAEHALARAENSAMTAVARAFVLADDAVRDKADALFDSKQRSPQLGVTFDYGSAKYFIIADSSTTMRLNQKRANVEEALLRMSNRRIDEDGSVEQILQETENDLVLIEDFLTELAVVVNKYKANNLENQTVYQIYQTSVASARGAISGSRSEIATAYVTLTSAEANLSLALRDMDFSVAGASEDTITAQEASVSAALAGVDTARERYEETKLVAPFDGIVARINKKEGEVVSPYEPFLEFLTDGAIEIEAYIPEADIAHVKLGNTAEITFDAYGKSDVFQAEVVRIALTETMREGVPTYKTTLRLVDDAQEEVLLRAGMTANVEILTNKRERVLFLPVRSVLRDGTRTYVRVFEGDTFIEKNITTGLRGSEGVVEVTAGLKEGDEVVLYVNE